MRAPPPWLPLLTFRMSWAEVWCDFKAKL